MSSGSVFGTFPKHNNLKFKSSRFCSRVTQVESKRKRVISVRNLKDQNQSDQQTNQNQQLNGNGKNLGEKVFGLGSLFGLSSFAQDKDIELPDQQQSNGIEVHEMQSIHDMTTKEWQQKYMKDGTVDLWLEDEFNAGSRLTGGRAVHKGGVYGVGSGEGPSQGDIASHSVKIYDHYKDQHIEVSVPEDRYILWEAEDAGLQLPYACRMGCCTACAVRIKKGEMYQPQALGISAELKEQGYALMCVGYPRSDLEIETVSEDEVYDLQFGQSFATGALNPTKDTVDRDDFALEIANMDE
eukprot:TRINITY_DN3540_c1_g2_i3.p1 TRINITY_DN3540_c1_g2~~TRINITY_DN3540_c1_g2_i3.p1  ORF type:complete len:297 (-),score=26.27 TRINITY_DN3540_c1_g2_i3:674-1564(-)